MEAACDTFYLTYKSSEQSSQVNDILKQLDFHPLSITLLATVAYHNKWDMHQLTKEWERRRMGLLHTQHNKSLASTIGLSLSSPMFQELGPDARGLLGVVAFFPQGVNVENLDWLFPTIPNRRNIFDKFSVLSLTYQSNGSITMLAPLRDYLCPKDPISSPLLCATKEHYFDRLSVGVYPGKPGYEEAQWITSEDVNIEHLLDVFTTIDGNLENVWDICSYFMEHLNLHEPRLVVLGPKIEGLPDDHPSKPRCLYQLAGLFHSVGRHVESKSLFTHTLKLCRKRGDNIGVIQALRRLADGNRLLNLHEEGIQQAKEALEMCENLNNVFELAHSLQYLALSLQDGGQPNAAKGAASRAVDLLQEDQFLVCLCHRILGITYCHEGKTEKAIEHLKVALGIASSFSLNNQQFWIHFSLALIFGQEGRFDDAQAHLEHAKSHKAHSTYLLGRTMVLQARLWWSQHRLEEARSEALCAANLYENIGATRDLEWCRDLIMEIEEEIESLVASGELDSGASFDGKLLKIVLLTTAINLTF